jgi:V/A-type H+-transporting ATPase subunit K
MVNITLGGQRDQMAFNRKKFSYLAITAGAVMLLMTFVTPPAFAAEGGDSALAKPILALAAAIAIAGGLIGTGSAQQGIGAAGMGIIAEKPEKFGQVLFFFVIPETLWSIGFVLGIIL